MTPSHPVSFPALEVVKETTHISSVAGVLALQYCESPKYRFPQLPTEMPLQGDDEQLMTTIHLANVACGFHASCAVFSLLTRFKATKRLCQRFFRHGQDRAPRQGEPRPRRRTPVTARPPGLRAARDGNGACSSSTPLYTVPRY